MSEKETVQPWDRQPGESSPAFAAFAAYRDAGPDRRLQQAARALDKSLGLLKRWSTRGRWSSRARAWDEHVDRTAQHSLEQRRRQELEDLRMRQLEEAQDFRKLASAGIAQLVVRDPESGKLALARDLTASEIVTLHKHGLSLERQALEQPAAGPAEADPSERSLLADLTAEELDALVLLGQQHQEGLGEEGEAET